MRIQIAVILLLAVATFPYSASQTPGPGHEANNPSFDRGRLFAATELAGLRDAALADDYAYRQVAHLTDNIGASAQWLSPGRSGRAICRR